MKTSSRARFSFAALALAALLAPLAGTAPAQTTATTTPVGFITLSVPAAVNASTPTNAALAIPLYGTVAFQSSVASVDSSTAFTFTGATFTANQYTTVPYIVHIQAGNSVGRSFLILSNTTAQVTLEMGTADLTTLLNPGDLVEIVQAATLGNVFGTSTPLVQSGASASQADNIFLWSGTTWDVFYNNGTHWMEAGSLLVQDNTVIFPDEGMFVTRRATTGPLTFTLMGTVPSTTEATVLAASGSTFLPNRFPVNVELVNLGLQTSTGWVSGASASQADNVYAWDTTTNTWDVYYFNGTNWKESGSLNIKDTTVIPAGTAVFITRASTTAATLAEALPYSLD